MSETQSPEQGVFARVLSSAMPPPGAEQRMVDGALARLERSSRRGRRALWGAAVSAAVACVLVALWIGYQLIQESDAPAPAPGPARAVAAPVWATADQPETRTIGPHWIYLQAHTRVRIASGDPAAARLVLLRGSAEFRVRPLARGERFEVRTQHVRLEVVGTRFSVASSARCSQVQVAEGVVRAIDVSSGETARLAAGKRRSYCAESTVGGGLGRGGRIVRRALRLLDAGDTDLGQAADLLARYLERYPDGAFAQEALFHLVFARTRQGRHHEARELAWLFLKRFPDTPRAGRLRVWIEKDQQQLDQN